MRYPFKPYIWSSHNIISQIINKERPKHILDVGCAEGFLANTLHYRASLLVGIEKEWIKKTPREYRKIWQADVEKNPLSFLQHAQFNVIVLADILEHLKHPDRTIKKLKRFLSSDGFFLISVPNMNFILVKILYGLGIKPRMARGIFDRTHIHHFTYSSICRFLTNNGLSINEIGITPFPLPRISYLFDKKYPFHFIHKSLYHLSKRFPSLLSYQVIIKATIKKEKCFTSHRQDFP